MKTHPHAPPRFFEAEAAGLRWLAEADGRRRGPRGARRRPRVPDPALGRARQTTVDAAAALRHGAGGHPPAGAPTYGNPDGPRRLHRPAAAARQARRHLGGVLRHPPGAALPQAGARPGRGRPPTTPPPSSRCSAGWPTWCPTSRPPGSTATCGTATCSGAPRAGPGVIDPAAHGGHRETDLAMLSLFGLPHLARVLEAYDDGRAARGGLGVRARDSTSCSRCWCTPATSAAATPPARPRPPRATSDPADPGAGGSGTPRDRSRRRLFPPGPRRLERRPPAPIPPDGVVCP